MVEVVVYIVIAVAIDVLIIVFCISGDSSGAVVAHTFRELLWFCGCGCGTLWLWLWWLLSM